MTRIIIAYFAIFIAGLIVDAVCPAQVAGAWRTALVKGALFGFFAYATYDLTNQATLSVWSTRITLADMAWGTFVSAVGSTGGFLLTRLATKG